MDFFPCTVRDEDLDDAESRASRQRRKQELLEARAARDSTLGEDYPRVRDFYKGQHVFITGGTGFIGKVIIEKLLRACPDVGTIYLLLRPKRGQDPQTRIRTMMSVPLFERLRQENPSALDKVVAIKGNCLENGLGLSPADRQTLVDRVSIVIHSAASVRFNDPVKTAVKLNLRSTVDIVELARQIKNLKVVVHVSTAFCFTNHTPTEERLYATDHEWRDVLKYANLPDADALDLLGNKFVGFQPNTYVFTKALSEHVVNEAALDLPIIIVRPTVVIGALEDPLPGWMDNLNGAAMFWYVNSKGIMRFSYTKDENLKWDCIPVDFVSTLTILASWAKGTNQNLPILSGNVEVVNISMIDVRPCTAFIYKALARRLAEDRILGIPGAIRYPRYGYCSSKVLTYILVFFYHIVFGTIVDTLLAVMGRKPMLMSTYRKIALSHEATDYFQNTQFWFNSDNQWRLLGMVHPKDRKDFDMNVFDWNWMQISKKQQLGVARYAVGDDVKEEDIDKYCRWNNRLWWAELCWYVCLVASIGGLLFARIIQVGTW